METPLGICLAKGPLTSTAYCNRTGAGGKNNTVLQTPCGPYATSTNAFEFADVSSVLPTITPKFNMATPLHKQLTVMRPAKQNKTVISLGGSPIYVGQTNQKGRRGKCTDTIDASPSDHVAFQLGDGRKLMIPTTDEAEGEENARPIDIYDDALAKMKALRNHLDSLLKMKNVS